MLQELKEILGIIKDLPHMVMWVLAGLLLYKVVVVGSIYGVIKLAIDRLHSWLVTPKVVTHQYDLKHLSMTTEAAEALSIFLGSAARDVKSFGGSYLYPDDIMRIKKRYDLGKLEEEKTKPKTATA
jgi:hypothetical protein